MPTATPTASPRIAVSLLVAVVAACQPGERGEIDGPPGMGGPGASEAGTASGGTGDSAGETGQTGGSASGPGGDEGQDTGDEPGDESGGTDPEPTTLCGKPPGFPRNDTVPNPVFAEEVDVNSTIVLDEPGVYDFENVLHRWTGSGSCNQNENQPYILRIAASDVTLKNFAYIDAPDGIHIGTANDGQGHSYGDDIGNIVLDNVTGWACEDALTTQYGVQDITIVDSTFLANPNPEHRDKLLQLNFGDATIDNTTFWGSDTCLMFKGNQDVVVTHSRFIDCNRAINGSTIHGIVGEVGTGPSTLMTECNEGYYAENAWMFWDSFKLATAYADVVATSVNDIVYDAGYHEAQDGGSMSVMCDPLLTAAELCGRAQLE